MNLIQSKRERCLFSFLILILIAFNSQICAQNPEEYNKIYTKTYLEVSQKDFPKALKTADPLFNISETPRYQAKSLMLSASLLQQVGEISKAVEFASKAETIIKNTEDYIWKAKISEFLASQYRQLKLVKESKKYINETMESIAKIDEPRIVNQTMGFVMQEKAYYEIEMKDFKNSINELRVGYIIEKFTTDPQYHKYKISTLAEEAGFSSQSKFAAVFRKVTDVSPSQFLEHLKTAQKD